MPRDGTETFVLPFPNVATSTTIESPVYNGFTNDIAQDLNTPRPIKFGGTGATSAAGALANLGGEMAGQVVTNYDSMVWLSGSFYSTSSASGEPVDGHAFSGIVYVTDSNNIVVEARDATDGQLYIRRKIAGVWGSWAIDVVLSGVAGAISALQTNKVEKAGDIMTGPLELPAAAPTLGTHATNKTYVDAADTALSSALTSSNTAQDTAIGNRVRFDAPHSPILTTAQKAQVRDSVAAPLRGYITGLTLNAPGGTGQATIAAGEAADSTNIDLMRLSSSYNKSTANWVVGASAGGLDFGAIAASTWYHVHLMKRPDTGVVDVCFSLSVAAPTTGGANPIPAAYTLFRRIGSIKTDGASQWIAFTQLGDDFAWAVPTLDMNLSSVAAGAYIGILTVPPGVQVMANVRGNYTSTTANSFGLLSSLDETLPGTLTGASGNTNLSNPTSGISSTWGQIILRTSTSAQIRFQATVAATTLRCMTVGWIDRRGRDA